MVFGGLLLVGALVGNTLSDKSGKTAEGNVRLSDVVLETKLPIKSSDFSLPFEIEGKARGTMFFEGSFPVFVIDDSGTILYRGLAQAQGEWMTEDYVSFVAELSASEEIAEDFVPTPPVVLVLEKDNPSGLPELSGRIKIPFLKF